MFEHKAYRIETLTNTHMGSGDTGFGMVDNLIQKDPVTSIPVFNSSSLKGAIKEHMSQCKETLGDGNFDTIFGTGADERDKVNNPGKVKFYEARLLTLPLRASKKVYYNATSPEVMLDFLDAVKEFKAVGLEVDDLKKLFNDAQAKLNRDKEFCIFGEDTDLEVEDYKKAGSLDDPGKNVNKLFKQMVGIDIKTLAVFKDDIFSEVCENSLPVIARNTIGEDGTSKNLFYEEVLPRRSKLWFMLGFDAKIEISPAFEEKLLGDITQFGANASLGYGMASIAKID